MTRLSEAHKVGILRGSRTRWLSAADTRPRWRGPGHHAEPGYTGTLGTTQEALRRRGLAEVRWDGRVMRYRLTDAGEELRLKMRAEMREARRRERVPTVLAAIRQAHELAAARPAGTEDGYIGEAFLLGECSNAVMERALAIRRGMHEEWARERAVA